MWLLDTTTLELCQVSDSAAETYAILSHTWDGNNEVSFQEIGNVPNAKRKSGFNKIERTCQIAKSKKIKHAWVDTCCIDKTSSAELSEAINSMFRWYKDSKICYVYLSDFEPLSLSLTEKQRLRETGTRLQKCRWFTRGWTLQELIAPRAIEFFDRDWNFIGGKQDLRVYLSSITNIDESVLRDSSGLQSIPIARKMSWAAGRQTTRLEDMAYSLLGLFEIHMPLLYGEGSKSFIRLQQQIASENSDLSLFAWSHSKSASSSFSGILATAPVDFSHCSNLRMHIDHFETIREFAITNAGLRMKENLLCPDPDVEGAFLLGLNCVECSSRTDNQPKWLSIRLTKVGSMFLRARSDGFVMAPDRTTWGTLQKTSSARHHGVIPDIYIQTLLRRDDIRRLQSLKNQGVTIVYGKNIVGGIRSRSGMPSWCCSSNPQKQVFVFNASGQDSFLGIHTFAIPVPEPFSETIFAEPPISKFALVCSLQWSGSDYELLVGLFQDDHIGNIMKAPFPTSSNRGTETEMLKGIKDTLFVKFSDNRGLLIQDQMPAARRTFLLGRSGTLLVRPLESHEKGVEIGAYKWKAGYHHVLLEHSLIGQAIGDGDNDAQS